MSGQIDAHRSGSTDGHLSGLLEGIQRYEEDLLHRRDTGSFESKSSFTYSTRSEQRQQANVRIGEEPVQIFKFGSAPNKCICHLGEPWPAAHSTNLLERLRLATVRTPLKL